MIVVPAETEFTEGDRFGFTGPADRRTVGPGVLTSREPFFFHISLPEGNYRVRATLGGLPDRDSNTTIKAESRRLMVRDLTAAAGATMTVEFLVNVRTAELPDGGQVILNQREIGVLHWDDRLTLEFGGPRPALAGLEIQPAGDAVTVYLAGDSTVTDQVAEPWSGWGQMLPAYFGPGVAVANHAESGLALRSFVAQRRLEKLMSTLRAGDYVLVQFGHNDQKEQGEGIGPFSSYTDSLIHFASVVRERGAFPVFVTSMYRRRFTGDQMDDTHGDYPVAMRLAAERHEIPLIDLHAGSRRIFEALGPEESKKAFVHVPSGTFPGQDEPISDDSHFSTYGGDLLARYVVEGIREKVPGLAVHLRTGLPPFDPDNPPPPSDWNLAPSPPAEFARPAGD